MNSCKGRVGGSPPHFAYAPCSICGLGLKFFSNTSLAEEIGFTFFFPLFFTSFSFPSIKKSSYFFFSAFGEVGGSIPLSIISTNILWCCNVVPGGFLGFFFLTLFSFGLSSFFFSLAKFTTLFVSACCWESFSGCGSFWSSCIIVSVCAGTGDKDVSFSSGAIFVSSGGGLSCSFSSGSCSIGVPISSGSLSRGGGSSDGGWATLRFDANVRTG
mmetsp:Transcript_17401/g.20905  ORF Transcript_17401/g.20905 Transcript_17401/m.20905 type:complete len:214 (+) Transcript_17401:1674-2315(+)